MLFNSYHFLIFFPIVLLIYFLIPKKIRYIWLLIASFYFYMSYSVKYFFLLLFSILVTYISGLALGSVNSTDHNAIFRKKLIVFESVFINIFILCIFKYSNFFFNTIANIFSIFNIELVEAPFSFILPVGISFYTFQALSYTIDVYRNDIKPEKNLLKYALFVSFFPQLVAGPIERSKDLLSQIEKTAEIQLWDFERIKNGIILMLWGFFLKVVIADRAAILVNTVFESYYMYSSLELIVAVICFAIQIYCDFGGYSTIALGAGKIMGFKLTENFNAPYFSKSISEFWKRWHISLGAWIKDYLYMPIRKRNNFQFNKHLALFISFFIIGMWHGANFTFIIACSIQGIIQIIENLLKPSFQKMHVFFKTKTESISYKLTQMSYVFIIQLFTLIFFRSNSLTDALAYLYRIITYINPWALFDNTLYTLGLNNFEFNILFVSLIILFIVDLIKYLTNKSLDDFLNTQCIWFRWGAIISLLFSILIFGIYGTLYDASQFIYFHF